MLDFLDRDIPDEARFSLLKKVFLTAATEDVSTRDAALADRLRDRLVRFEDLAKLETSELQALFRRVPMPAVAPLLLAEPQVLMQIVTKLPQGLAQRLTQEVDLSRPLTPERARNESRRVIQALKTLAAEGWIVLRKKKPAEPPAAPAPAAPAPEGG